MKKKTNRNGGACIGLSIQQMCHWNCEDSGTQPAVEVLRQANWRIIQSQPIHMLCKKAKNRTLQEIHK